MHHVDRWKNRRRMAWLSLASGLGFPLLLLGTDSPELGEIAYPFYLFVGSVVGAYVGFATLDDRWTNDARHRVQGKNNFRRPSPRRGDSARVDDEWVEAERADRPNGF